MAFTTKFASLSGVAGSREVDGYQKHTFMVRNVVTFIANDSATNSLLVNLDGTIGQPGTFELKPGEVLSDLITQCDEMYVQGVGAEVPFRAVGS